MFFLISFPILIVAYLKRNVKKKIKKLDNADYLVYAVAMDNLPVEIDNQHLPETKTNPYAPLLDEARSVLRREMLNSKDSKLVIKVATEILDRGGESKKEDNSERQAPIVIRDSHVQLLVKTALEVTEG